MSAFLYVFDIRSLINRIEFSRLIPDIETDPTPGISKSPTGPTVVGKNIFSIVLMFIPNTSPGPIM